MTDHKRRRPVDSKALYRELIGPLHSDTAADEFAAMKDTRGNRAQLAYLAGRGGERGRAARAQLDKWEADDAEPLRSPLDDRQVTSGRRRAVDPFDGPPAA
ncbi:hypothetical protein LIX60_17475 [Streptomyces sp. S07_1.15]|uniref:hypothetical protein n=1 Tax=Streptomyces sp. S07_1.15 TaxID=2873925 RepID=UPI001D156EEE|nr:hypothetical protein [Streptomyces sp. S07_1.15]MCC3653220.1 hypothetical protein [Streptomyces sp. S07_1.15]